MGKPCTVIDFSQAAMTLGLKNIFQIRATDLVRTWSKQLSYRECTQPCNLDYIPEILRWPS